MRKALADEHGQHVMALARDLAGARGMLAEHRSGRRSTRWAGTARPGPTWPGGLWDYGFLFAPALTIGGGTAEVQRNIIAERTLGLPHDPPA